jgi:uncharacterized protein
MRIAITGSSGFLGSALQAHLGRAGHTFLRVVRRPASGPDETQWDPVAGRIDPRAFEGIDAGLHLAGEGIGERRWSAAQKRRILGSRTLGTALLAETLAKLDAPPAVLVSQSAVDYYGDRGDEVLTEDSGPGREGFLPQVVSAWEAAADPARTAGIRVVHPRTGIVLSAQGGALPRLLTIFRLGLGGPLGRGRQYWPWIGIDDQLALTEHVLTTPAVVGPVNFVSPNPVTNAVFSRTLARLLRRPAVLPVPRFAPAVLYGRPLVDELLYASRRVLPERALASGYAFAQPHLEACLRAVLDRPAG